MLSLFHVTKKLQYVCVVSANADITLKSEKVLSVNVKNETMMKTHHYYLMLF